MPPLRVPVMLRERPMTLAQSTLTEAGSTSKPQSLPWRMASMYSSALCRSALVGMQPQLRQTPPSLPRSMQATLRPIWAARMAPT